MLSKSETDVHAHGRLWTAAQSIGVVATVVLVSTLVLVPRLGLSVLWNVLIPLVPASLLVSPAVWRNVCPLATLNVATGLRGTRRPLPAGRTPLTGVAGIALLGVLVPARRFVFNTDGPVLAAVVVAVALAALVLGTRYDLKAGFCNAVCPVLPVERLYGQRPLLPVSNARCQPCSLCTATGCIDLSPRKSVAQTLGPARRNGRWLRRPFGAFAAAFPGFVLGYFTLSDGGLATAAGVYAHVGLYSLASFAVVAALVLGARLPAARVMPSLAALGAGIYYWFAAGASVPALGGGSTVVWVVRIALLALVAGWWLNTFTTRGALRSVFVT